MPQAVPWRSSRRVHRCSAPTLQFGHRPQPHGPYRSTASPTSTPVVPAPSASTVPATSWPIVNGSSYGTVPAGQCMRCRSEWQRPGSLDAQQELARPGHRPRDVAHLHGPLPRDELDGAHARVVRPGAGGGELGHGGGHRATT